MPPCWNGELKEKNNNARNTAEQAIDDSSCINLLYLYGASTILHIIPALLSVAYSGAGLFCYRYSFPLHCTNILIRSFTSSP